MVGECHRSYCVQLASRGDDHRHRVMDENGRQVSQEWTGVTYRSTKEAYADMKRVNRGGRRS
jgi:hypothetical protein